MPFTSIHFLFFFLPAFLLLFYLIPSRGWRNAILMVGSLVFFAWMDITHVPQLALFVLLNYFFGLGISKLLAQERVLAARTVTSIGVAVNLLGLVFYKYLGFFGSIFESLTGIDLQFAVPALPLGISYLTFSTIAYLVDVFNGTIIAERSFLRFANYLVMFPKLTQGPITRYSQVQDALTETKRVDFALLMQGTRRFITGLAKKVILADSLAVVADKVFSGSFAAIGADLAWFGLVAYMMQIYFDFSGYTDMAIGLGNMFGFTLPENFNYPYISRSITDFWRRWHMTLTQWFRTYVFFPLEFARRKVRFFRLPIDILIVFLLTGFWHGANWNFLIWGGYFGLVLAFEASGWNRKLTRLPIFMQHAYSLTLILLGWVFFRLTDVSQWGGFFGALFGRNGWTGMETLRTQNVVFYLPILLAAVLFATPVIANLEKRLTTRFANARVWMDLATLGLFLLTLCYILSNGFSTFMYAQF